MKARHFLFAGLALVAAPFVWKFMSLELADRIFTVILALLAAFVVFECGFRMLQDFGGAPHD